MWVFGEICLKQGCKNAARNPNLRFPQVFLHESQFNRFIECREGEGHETFRLLNQDHIGKVVVCVDHFPAETQNLIFQLMSQGSFEWSHLSREQMSRAQICIGYGTQYHKEKHSQWKKANSRNPKFEWRYTPVNRRALKPSNLVDPYGIDNPIVMLEPEIQPVIKKTKNEDDFCLKTELANMKMDFEHRFVKNESDIQEIKTTVSNNTQIMTTVQSNFLEMSRAIKDLHENNASFKKSLHEPQAELFQNLKANYQELQATQSMILQYVSILPPIKN